MTAIRLTARRLAIGLSGITLEAMALVLVALVALGAAALAFGGAAEDKAPQAQVRISLGEARSLIAATSGEASAELDATGDRAKLINASLPFSASPIQAARPFDIGSDALDHKRALLCLTQAVYYEAGFEPLSGRRAVAQVVLNRMRHPAFPKSVCGVVYQGAKAPVCQFSFTCDGSLYRAPAAAAWRQAQDIARAALDGYVEKSVGSATHYHADYVAPRWAPMLTKISKIGAHIFYRWPGSWGQRGAFTGRYIGEPNDPLGLRPPPPAETGEATAVLAAATVEAGPPVARAANDVGGLLDVSKGWTLNIPGPNDIGGATARALAEQKARSNAPSATVAATAAPVVASR